MRRRAEKTVVIHVPILVPANTLGPRGYETQGPWGHGASQGHREPETQGPWDQGLPSDPGTRGTQGRSDQGVRGVQEIQTINYLISEATGGTK